MHQSEVPERVFKIKNYGMESFVILPRINILAQQSIGSKKTTCVQNVGTRAPKMEPILQCIELAANLSDNYKLIKRLVP